MKTIAIIGGGVTGVTTAYALARRGYAVTLLERHLQMLEAVGVDDSFWWVGKRSCLFKRFDSRFV